MGRMMRFFKIAHFVLGIACLVFVAAGTVMMFAQEGCAQEEIVEVETDSSFYGWAFIAAALAVGISSLAAGFAVSNIGSAAMGAVSERPELMGRSLIYVGLAEGIAIYGLIVAIMILGRI